jgi:DNA-binding MarR family transcriptional regulator
MENSLSVDKDYALWVLLLQMRDAALKLREKELSQYGISPEQAGVLFIIHTIGNTATPVEISRWLLRKHHTVLGILGRMEKAGLVRKTKDPERKNLVRVTLTEKGRQAYYQSTR